MRNLLYSLMNYYTYPYTYSYVTNNINTFCVPIATVPSIAYCSQIIGLQNPYIYTTQPIYMSTRPVYLYTQPPSQFNHFVPPPYYQQAIAEKISFISEMDQDNSSFNRPSTSLSTSSVSFNTPNTSFSTADITFDTANTSFHTTNSSAANTSFDTANSGPSASTSFNNNEETNTRIINTTVSSLTSGFSMLSIRTNSRTLTTQEAARPSPVAPRSEPLENYFKLPRELFPPARSLKIDPNPIIDVLCKLPNIEKHLPWISDIEFGIPKKTVTRLLAQFDIKTMGVICKNNYGIAYPEYEICPKEFKHFISLYYDYILSVWYRGYLSSYQNFSRIDFENWLAIPMEAVGMCWP